MKYVQAFTFVVITALSCEAVSIADISRDLDIVWPDQKADRLNALVHSFANKPRAGQILSELSHIQDSKWEAYLTDRKYVLTCNGFVFELLPVIAIPERSKRIKKYYIHLVTKKNPKASAAQKISVNLAASNIGAVAAAMPIREVPVYISEKVESAMAG